MLELILAIVMALISYFAAKEKTGASSTQAAMAAAAAGLGTYYIASETEWGQGVVDSKGLARVSVRGPAAVNRMSNPDLGVCLR